MVMSWKEKVQDQRPWCVRGLWYNGMQKSSINVKFMGASRQDLDAATRSVSCGSYT